MDIHGHGHGYSTSIRKKFAGIRSSLLRNWEGIRVLGKVFVYFFNFLKMFEYFFKYVLLTFEYFGILWNILEYFGIL